jgi:hypothetical protein
MTWTSGFARPCWTSSSLAGLAVTTRAAGGGAYREALAGPRPENKVIEEVIGAARRALALKHHPDKRGGNAAKMQMINSACDWLLEITRSGT